jgi:ATP phosphoribosyltransferase
MKNSLRIAMPKGRLMNAALDFLSQAGLAPEDGVDLGRRLVFSLPEATEALGVNVEVLAVKNADVATYVEHGVAEFGVCGTDVLNESGADVLRPYTFPFGRCRIVIAGREGMSIEQFEVGDTIRVASKFPRTTLKHFAYRGWNPEIIKLNGSVELGAVLGISDVIVDLVETGKTLRENNLEVLEDLGGTSVKLIAARSLARRQTRLLGELVDRFREVDAGGID